MELLGGPMEISLASIVTVGEGRPSTFSFVFHCGFVEPDKLGQKQKLEDGRPSPLLSG